MKKNGTAMMIIVLAAAIVLAGCSETRNDGAVEFNEDEGSVTLTDNEGKDVVITNKQELPEQFPDEIPMPDGIKIVSSITNSNSVTVAIETVLPFEEVVTLYDDYLQEAGYKESFKMDESDFYNYSGQKGNEQFVVTLQLDQEDNKTVTGVLVYSKVQG